MGVKSGVGVAPKYPCAVRYSLTVKCTRWVYQLFALVGYLRQAAERPLYQILSVGDRVAGVDSI